MTNLALRLARPQPSMIRTAYDSSSVKNLAMVLRIATHRTVVYRKLPRPRSGIILETIPDPFSRGSSFWWQLVQLGVLRNLVVSLSCPRPWPCPCPCPSCLDHYSRRCPVLQQTRRLSLLNRSVECVSVISRGFHVRTGAASLIRRTLLLSHRARLFFHAPTHADKLFSWSQTSRRFPGAIVV